MTETTDPTQARIAYLLELSDRLRLFDDPCAIQRAALQQLCEALAVPCGYFAELDAREKMIVTAEHLSGGAPSLRGARSLACQLELLEELRHGQPRVVERSLECQTSHLTAERAADFFHAYCLVPWITSRGLSAVVELCAFAPRSWSARDLALIAETVERTCDAVERARTQERLSQSERRAHERLAEALAAQARAEDTNRMHEELLAMVTHELQTPLTAIQLWARSMQDGLPTDDHARAIDAIAHSAELQSRLIDDLRAYSPIAKDALALTLSTVELTSMAESAVDLVRSVVAAKQQVLEVDIAAGLGTARLDGARVAQIMRTLLADTARFTPAAGTVHLRLQKCEAALQIEVSGCGARNGPERAAARVHGAGASFRFVLPDAFVPATEVEQGSAPEQVRSARPLLTGLRVLLVEDDAHSREAMHWVLASAGAIVRVAETAEHALEELNEAGAVEVLISDLSLPGTSGLELMQRVVAHCREQGRPVLPSCAISAHVREHDRQQAIEAGFDMYLTKPTTPERLLEAVDTLQSLLRATDPALADS